MAAQVSLQTQLSGGLISGLLKKFLGGESLFVNTFSNPTRQPLELVLTQSTLGDIACIDLREREVCFQPGAYIVVGSQDKLGNKVHLTSRIHPLKLKLLSEPNDLSCFTAPGFAPGSRLMKRIAVGLSLGSAVISGLPLFVGSVQGLPPPNDTPEEVLRTEIITEARSPVDGEPLSAAEYAELQAALRSTEAVQPKVSPRISRLIGLLRLRKVIRSVFPFLLR